MNRKSKKNYYSDLFLKYKDNIKKTKQIRNGAGISPLWFSQNFFFGFFRERVFYKVL